MQVPKSEFVLREREQQSLGRSITGLFGKLPVTEAEASALMDRMIAQRDYRDAVSSVVDSLLSGRIVRR